MKGVALLAAAAALLSAAGAPSAPRAQEGSPPTAEQTAQPPVQPERWAVHIQATDILQYYPAFHSPFQGPQSFRPQATWGNTVDATHAPAARQVAMTQASNRRPAAGTSPLAAR